MLNTSYLEISTGALKKNFRFLRKALGDVRISSVVKGNAYGHEITTIVPLIEECGVEHFSVFSSFEAKQVKFVCKEGTSIMIMGYIDDDDMEWVIRNDVEFFVFDLERLQKALDEAKKQEEKARIHLEVETGLNRTGLSKAVLSKAISFIKRNREHFVVEGLCTHFAGAESVSNYLRIKNQHSEFKKLSAYVRKRGLTPKYRHTACSAAALNYPKSRMDMVRIGIMQYGLWPSTETFIFYSAQNKAKRNDLKRVISWKSRIMVIKEIKKGDYIGYGTNFIAPYPMKVAVIPVGYSQGYTRTLSFQGRVLIRGRRMDVTGLVNMNSITVDVTRIPDVKQGDEVVLIGDQGRHSITISSFNEVTSQLNNELLTRLPMDIPRRVVK